MIAAAFTRVEFAVRVVPTEKVVALTVVAFTFVAATIFVFTVVELARVEPITTADVLTVVVPIVKLIGFRVAVFVEFASLILVEFARAFAVEFPMNTSVVVICILDPTFAEVEAKRVPVFTCPVTFNAAVLTKVLFAVVEPTAIVEVLRTVVPIVNEMGVSVEVFVELATTTCEELWVEFTVELPTKSCEVVN